MLPRWYERQEALTRHVHADFESSICDGAGMTYTSVVIFHLRLLMAIRAVRLTLSNLIASNSRRFYRQTPPNPSQEGGC